VEAQERVVSIVNTPSAISLVKTVEEREEVPETGAERRKLWVASDRSDDDGRLSNVSGPFQSSFSLWMEQSQVWYYTG